MTTAADYRKEYEKKFKSDQHQPWSVQIEPTEGCNRRCGFCGINAIRPGERQACNPYRHMSLELAESVASELADLCPEARVEFAMHGEPMMHPKIFDLLAIFRKHLPKAQFLICTNGKTMMVSPEKMQKDVERLLQTCDMVMIDTYYPERDELQKMIWELPFGPDEPIKNIVDYYDEWHPEGMSPYANMRRKTRDTVVVMDDIGKRSGESKVRVLMNHAGSNPGMPEAPEPLQKTCTNPFREITVCYNGAVNICCMDWKHEYVCGYAQDQTLADIWYGPEFAAARAMLQSKDRNFGPCQRCTKNAGTRVGLCPKIPEPTSVQRTLVERITEKGSQNPPLTPVKRKK